MGSNNGTATLKQISKEINLPVTTVRNWETRMGFNDPSLFRNVDVFKKIKKMKAKDKTKTFKEIGKVIKNSFSKPKTVFKTKKITSKQNSEYFGTYVLSKELNVSTKRVESWTKNFAIKSKKFSRKTEFNLAQLITIRDTIKKLKGKATTVNVSKASGIPLIKTPKGKIVLTLAPFKDANLRRKVELLKTKQKVESTVKKVKRVKETKSQIALNIPNHLVVGVKALSKFSGRTENEIVSDALTNFLSSADWINTGVTYLLDRATVLSKKKDSKNASKVYFEIIELLSSRVKFLT